MRALTIETCRLPGCPSYLPLIARPHRPVESLLSFAGMPANSVADGNIGQIGEKVGGPFSADGAIGSQFDASKDGIAGQVEKAVDGPAQRPS